MVRFKGPTIRRDGEFALIGSQNETLIINCYYRRFHTRAPISYMYTPVYMVKCNRELDILEI